MHLTVTLLTVIVVGNGPSLVGCDSDPAAPRLQVAHAELPPDLPVVDLKLVDLGGDVDSTKIEAVAPMEVAIPDTDFVVRFQGKRPAGKRHMPVIFKVARRTQAGVWSTTTTCTVHPIDNVEDDIAGYEGVCRAPVKQGAFLVTLNCRGRQCFAKTSRSDAPK